MNELYPLKFAPVLIEKIWGGNNLYNIFNKGNGKNRIGESWEISGIQDRSSVVQNGFLKNNSLNELIEVYMGDLVGERVYEYFGAEFPLLFKFIDATDILSLQVHPDNEMAERLHHAYGKAEMWYILESNNGFIYNGFKEKTNELTFEKCKTNDDFLRIVNRIDVEKGDVFYIPPGRIHATGPGVVLAEIQQASDITYRVWDWERKDRKGKNRELHQDLAKKALNFRVEPTYQVNYENEKNKRSVLVENQFFNTSLLDLETNVEMNYITIDSFVVYMCIDGSASIDAGSKAIEISKGETILLPASIEHVKINPVKEVRILETWIP